MGDLHNGWFIVANPVKMDYCILLCFFKLLNCWFSWFPQYRRWSFVAFVFFMYIYSACIVASCYRLLPIRWSKESAMFVGMFAKQWHIHIYIYGIKKSSNIYEYLWNSWFCLKSEVALTDLDSVKTSPLDGWSSRWGFHRGYPQIIEVKPSSYWGTPSLGSPI